MKYITLIALLFSFKAHAAPAWIWDSYGNPIGSTAGALNVSGTFSATVSGQIPSGHARNDYSVTSVTTSAYTQLFASTAAVINAIEIFDSSGQTLALAFGTPGSEVDQLYIIPGGNGRIPLSIPLGTRVSIKAVTATASAGYIDVNLYN